MFSSLKLKDIQVAGKAGAVIQRPCDDVFNFVGVDFLRNYPRWSPEVLDLKSLTEGPIKLGTLCHQVRIDQGKRSESTFKVTAFQPGRRICFEGTSSPYRCDYVLEPVNPTSASQIIFSLELLKLELYMRPFEKLIRLAVQDDTERTVRNIKRLIENEIAEPAAP